MKSLGAHAARMLFAERMRSKLLAESKNVSESALLVMSRVGNYTLQHASRVRYQGMRLIYDRA